MKNVFNFSRFGKYIAYDLKRIRSSYGLTFLLRIRYGEEVRLVLADAPRILI